MSHGTHPAASAPGATRHRAWLGGAVFTAGFVGNGVLTGAVTDTPLPLPDAAPAEVLTYFATETPAVVVSAVCILVSTLGLALFAREVGAIARPDPKRTVAGAVAIAALAASGLLGLLLAVLGPAGADSAVLVVRSLNFVTGGVVHVVALGGYVATLSLLRPGSRTFGPGVRRFGAVAAVLAVLSIASVVFYPASILLPVGRLLCMVWTVTAGVALARATRGC
jgi:hypothetical protein